MKNKEALLLLKEQLDKLYPHTECFLNHKTDYELLFAVIMSAQSQDKYVNMVNEILFKTYPTLESFSHADSNDIEVIIKPIGFAHTKAINIVKCAQLLLEKYNGVVPQSRDDLMSLPGVGYKTASVVRGELFGLDEFPVDTHVFRIMTRLNIVSSKKSPQEIEMILTKLTKGMDMMHFHRQVITFGREICKANKTRKCSNCSLEWCKDRIG